MICYSKRKRMMSGTKRHPLRVEIDRAAGRARMCKGDWQQSVPGEDLVKWLRLYRALWSRKPSSKGTTANDKNPGPWAGFYEDDVRALECAVKEWMA